MGYFGIRCSFTNRDLYCWAGAGSERRAWLKELKRVIVQSEEAHHAKMKQLEVDPTHPLIYLPNHSTTPLTHPPNYPPTPLTIYPLCHQLTNSLHHHH